MTQFVELHTAHDGKPVFVNPSCVALVEAGVPENSSRIHILPVLHPITVRGLPADVRKALQEGSVL